MHSYCPRLCFAATHTVRDKRVRCQSYASDVTEVSTETCVFKLSFLPLMKVINDVFPVAHSHVSTRQEADFM